MRDDVSWLYFISLMTNDIKVVHLFTWLWPFGHLLWGWGSTWVLCPLFVCVCSWVISLLYIAWMLLSYQTDDFQIFCPVLLFVFLFFWYNTIFLHKCSIFSALLVSFILPHAVLLLSSVLGFSLNSSLHHFFKAELVVMKPFNSFCFSRKLFISFSSKGKLCWIE